MIQRLLDLVWRRPAASAVDELDWFWPPTTLTDPAVWDTYWRNQLTHGMAGLVDMFCDDGDLVDAMRASGFQTVLCVGNGLSLEPRALAAAGFEVTALDLSPFALSAAERATPPADYLAGLIGGRPQREGGRVTFVVGDLCDSRNCPGPFDVVIERRTLQLYQPDQQGNALQRVADRLDSRGILFSHCHDARWRPPASPRHACEDWFADQAWPRWDGHTPVTERVAWLSVSTG